MSMPNFPEHNNIPLEQAIGLVISSIGYEELALAHILNAEGEKIQSALESLKNHAHSKVSIDDIIKIDSSVESTLTKVAQKELLLLWKLEEARKLLCGYDCFKKNKRESKSDCKSDCNDKESGCDEY